MFADSGPAIALLLARPTRAQVNLPLAGVFAFVTSFRPESCHDGSGVERFPAALYIVLPLQKINSLPLYMNF